MSVGLERQLAVKSKNHSTKEMESQMFRVKGAATLILSEKSEWASCWKPDLFLNRVHESENGWCSPLF